MVNKKLLLKTYIDFMHLNAKRDQRAWRKKQQNCIITVHWRQFQLQK